MSDQRPTFVELYNRSSFQFDHALHHVTAFDTPALVAISRRLSDGVYCSTAPSAVGDGWKNVGARRLSLQETLEAMDESDSLVLLRHCERDPEFGPIVRSIMDEIVDQVGDELRNDVEAGRATLVISSPGRVTSYHIDAEVNFLLQVRGEKLLYAFDGYDRTLLTDPELEAFYGGDPDGARYKSERQDEAAVYALKPGKGVQLPLHAPHWTQNGSSTSVGLSLNFNLRSSGRSARVYKINRRLRQAGFAPLAPGVSAWEDHLKLAALKSFSVVRPFLRYARAGRAGGGDGRS